MLSAEQEQQIREAFAEGDRIIAVKLDMGNDMGDTLFFKSAEDAIESTNSIKDNLEKYQVDCKIQVGYIQFTTKSEIRKRLKWIDGMYSLSKLAELLFTPNKQPHAN